MLKGELIFIASSHLGNLQHRSKDYMHKAKTRKKPFGDIDAKEIKTFLLSKEEYEQNLLEGADPEYTMKPGVYKYVRGGLMRRQAEAESKEAIKPQNTKVRITMYVDLDVLNFFKECAEEVNAAPYQTQMNNALREFMNGQQPKQEILLNDEEFIRKVAQKVAEIEKRQAKNRRSKRAA